MQLRDELTTLLLAGHDTTANALAWAWLLLADNPAVEERLHAEVDDVIGGRAPVPDDLPALEFTKKVFAEAMRLYPPAWLLGRVAVERHEARGFVISPGSLVVLSPWVVHRDGRFYRDPERFDPDRWTPEHEQSPSPVCLFPVRRRFQRVHGRGVCVDGRHSHSRHNRPAVALPPRGRGNARALSRAHAQAASGRYACDEKMSEQSAPALVQMPFRRGRPRTASIPDRGILPAR